MQGGTLVCKNVALILLAAFVSLCLIVYFRLEILINNFEAFSLKTNLNNYTFKSSCDCRKQIVHLNETKYDFVVSKLKSDGNQTTIISKYSIPKNTGLSETEQFMCNPYNVLRHGPNQKVLSYSLYGNNELYYTLIKKLIRQVHSLYPGWLIRINHDSSIRDSIRCEIECLEDENGVQYDIADFCNVEQLPVNLGKKTYWNATFIHAMMWRWLPLGDYFVEIFSSRDLDSPVLQREVDSVDVWLKSNKLFHIMRGKYNILHLYFSIYRF